MDNSGQTDLQGNEYQELGKLGPGGILSYQGSCQGVFPTAVIMYMAPANPKGPLSLFLSVEA